MKTALPRTYKQLMAQKNSAEHCEKILSPGGKNTIWHFWEDNSTGIVIKASKREKELREEHQHNKLAKAMNVKVVDMALYQADNEVAIAWKFMPGITAEKFHQWHTEPDQITNEMSKKIKMAHVGTAILGLVDSHDENMLFCPDHKRQKDFYNIQDFKNADVYIIDTALAYKSDKADHQEFEYQMMEFDVMRQSVGMLFDYQQGILDLDTIEDVELKKCLAENMSSGHQGLLQAEVSHDDYIQCALDHKAALIENQVMLEKEGLGDCGLVLQQRCDDMVSHLQALKLQNKPI